MKAVCLWSQDGPEGSACRLPHGAQLACITPVPIGENRHFSAVVQPDTRDIDSIAKAVFRQARTRLVVARTAGIMRNNPQGRQTATRVANRGSDTCFDLCFQGCSSATINRRRGRQRDTRHGCQADRVFNPAGTRTFNCADDFTKQGRIAADISGTDGRFGGLARTPSKGDDQGECNRAPHDLRLRPKFAASVSCPASMMPRRMDRVRVK